MSIPAEKQKPGWRSTSLSRGPGPWEEVKGLVGFAIECSRLARECQMEPDDVDDGADADDNNEGSNHPKGFLGLKDASIFGYVSFVKIISSFQIFTTFSELTITPYGLKQSSMDRNIRCERSQDPLYGPG